MRIYWWLLSNWPYVLQVGLAMITVYLAIRTYRLLSRDSSEPGVNPSARKVQDSKVRIFKLGVAPILTFVLFAILLTIMILSFFYRRPQPTDNPPVAGGYTIRVTKNESADVGELKIKITDIKFDYESKKYRITATVSSPGEPEMEIYEAETSEASTYSYPQNVKFRIKIPSADANSATFLVQQKSD